MARENELSKNSYFKMLSIFLTLGIICVDLEFSRLNNNMFENFFIDALTVQSILISLLLTKWLLLRPSVVCSAIYIQNK